MAAAVTVAKPRKLKMLVWRQQQPEEKAKDVAEATAAIAKATAAVEEKRKQIAATAAAAARVASLKAAKEIKGPFLEISGSGQTAVE